MLDRALIAFVPVGGLALGALVWLAAAGHGAPAAVSQLDARLTSIPSGRPTPSLSAASAFQALATPLFPSATAGPVVDLALSLEGVVNFPGRVAALLSVNGAPAQWLALGETRDGVALQEVRGASVLLSTAAGPRELAIGDAPTPPVQSDVPPPGARSPPPPASAPGVAQ